MNKPEKRKLNKESVYLQYDKGFNHCYDEFERFLPSEVKIAEIVWDSIQVSLDKVPHLLTKGRKEFENILKEEEIDKVVAKAIYEEINPKTKTSIDNH